MDHLDDVFRYAMSRLGSREDAEDVAIEVVQALPNPCFKKELRSYMVGMARRKIADRLRRLQPCAELRDTDAGRSFEAEAHTAALVSEVLALLDEGQRDLLSLKYVAGLSSGEIGKLLGIRSDAVDSRLQRARDSFARAWKQIAQEETV